MILESRRRWRGLVVLGLAVALVVVDITIVNVSMLAIIADLDLDFTDAEWVNATYAAVFAALLITLGRLGDVIGRRRMLVAGLVTFLLASLAAGRTESLGGLLGARALQGVGAAMILPTTLAMVNTMFRGRDRAIAFGVWGAVIAGMAAVGPILGGWLTTEFGWSWIFLINVPVAAALIVAALVALDPQDGGEGRGFDLPGFALASLGFFFVVIAVIEGPRYGWLAAVGELEIGGRSWPLAVSAVPLAFALGLAALVGFVAVERARLAAGRHALFDLGLFRIRSFRNGNVLAALVGVGEFGLIFVVPLYLQTAVGVSALRTGVLILAMAAGGFLGGPAAGLVARRSGPRQAVTTGMALEALGALGVALAIAPDRITGGLALALFVYGLGVGFASSQLASVILSEVPDSQSGQASGMQSTVRQVGAALGIAVLGTLFVTSMAAFASDRLDAIQGLVDPQRRNIVEGLTDSAGWYVAALRAWTPDFVVVVDAVERAITDAARVAAFFAAGAFLAGTAVSRRLPDVLRESRSIATAREH